MTKLIVTCEHGGNHIPGGFAKYITDLEVNDSHRAYDSGAYNLYSEIAKNYADFSQSSKISRLLIDFNRSLVNRNIYTEYSRTVPAEQKGELVNMYKNYRISVNRFIRNSIKRNYTAIHLSIHTFVPELHGVVRNNDIGILFDPKNENEKLLASRWKSILKNIEPAYKVRFNYPYLGISDGFTTYLRKVFTYNYLGIELEVNQKHVKNNRINEDLKEQIIQSIGNLITLYKP